MVHAALGDRWARFKAGFVLHWGERMEREQDVLAGLRTHPGFDALLDTFDAEIVSIWDRIMVEEDPGKAEGLRQQAKAMWRMVRLIEDRTRAKQVAEAQQAEIQRMRAMAAENGDRRRFMVERARQAQATG